MSTGLGAARAASETKREAAEVIHRHQGLLSGIYDFYNNLLAITSSPEPQGPGNAKASGWRPVPRTKTALEMATPNKTRGIRDDKQATNAESTHQGPHRHRHQQYRRSASSHDRLGIDPTTFVLAGVKTRAARAGRPWPASTSIRSSPRARWRRPWWWGWR